MNHGKENFYNEETISQIIAFLGKFLDPLR